MSLVTVYAYKVYSAEQDGFEPANVFATLETIKENELLRPIMSVSLQVDSSQINERGRYHPPETTPEA